ncbi:MAG: GDSL-type esterase/lipase family protein, partial [Prevotella sp.]|nr:GDSL-type esterase/lipase family protein [Prevotella sp.]
AEAKAFNPDVVVIKLGTNDSKPINWTLHSKQYTADMQQMIDELKALPSRPVIYLCTPLQANHVTTDTERQIRNEVIASEVIPMIQKVAKKNKLEIIDLYPEIDPNGDAMSKDGIHPSAKGAGVMAKKIAGVVRNVKVADK